MTTMSSVFLFLKGVVYGVVNLLPGIGGGIILVILGIYEQFVSSVGNLFLDLRNWRKHLSFLIPMGLGAAAGMILFAKGVSALMGSHPAPAMFFFMGLVIGTIPSVLKLHGDMRPTAGRVTALLVGLVLGILFKVAQSQSLEAGLVARADSVSGFIYYVFANIIAGGASVTPGMDGSYIWMLTGIFEQVMGAIGSVTELLAVLSSGGLGAALAGVHWSVLFSTGIGAVVGIVFFAKLIDLAIKRVPGVSYYTVLGLLLASVYGLWPPARGFGEEASLELWPAGLQLSVGDVVLVIVAFAVGAAITLYSGAHGEPEPAVAEASPSEV